MRASSGDLAGHKVSPRRGLMVEQDAVAGIEPIGFPIIHGDPVAIELATA